MAVHAYSSDGRPVAEVSPRNVRCSRRVHRRPRCQLRADQTERERGCSRHGVAAPASATAPGYPDRVGRWSDHRRAAHPAVERGAAFTEMDDLGPRPLRGETAEHDVRTDRELDRYGPSEPGERMESELVRRAECRAVCGVGASDGLAGCHAVSTKRAIAALTSAGRERVSQWSESRATTAQSGRCSSIASQRGEWNMTGLRLP